MLFISRKPTRQIQVGDVAVGGDAPITVQSMTTTKTGLSGESPRAFLRSSEFL